MDPQVLARLEHENMVETLVVVGGQAPGALVTRADGVALIATGLPLRLFNQVLIEGEAVAPEAIAAAVATTRARGDRFVVNLRAGTDDRYLPLMAELDLVPMSADPWMPGMALHPLPARDRVPPAPGHEIRRVTDGPGVRDHILTAAAGFEMPVDWVEAIMTEALAVRRRPPSTSATRTVTPCPPGSASGPAGPSASTTSPRSRPRAAAATGPR